MRRILPLLTPALTLAAVTLPTPPSPAAANPDRVEQLLEQFGGLTSRTNSLTITLSTASRDPWSEPQQWEGTARLRRAADGTVRARYEAARKGTGTGAGDERWAVLLVGDDLYLLNLAERKAVRFSLAGRDKVGWLAEWFPFAAFLDAARLRRDYRLRVTKQDGWYTYLDVAPRRRERRGRGWHADALVRGRAVVLNRATDRIPTGAPCQLWYATETAEKLYEIQAWTVNAPDGPKESDFERPEKLPGWTTVAQ